MRYIPPLLFWTLLLNVFWNLAGISAQGTEQGPPAQIAPTYEIDKRALLKFKQAIEHHGGRLANWLRRTDPCIHRWTGVECNCSTLQTDVELQFCGGFEASDENSRIIKLGLTGTFTEKINGTIAAALGDLKELRILDLSDNNLRGNVPEELGNLEMLQFLSLRGNLLIGNVPEFLQRLPKLQQVHLDVNQFTGKLPEAWCKGDKPRFNISISNNVGICGEIPECFSKLATEEQDELDGTNLIRNDTGGLCDPTPPSCLDEFGCSIMVPDFYTNLSIVNFNFTDFVDDESNISEYTFHVGTQRYGFETVRNQQLPFPNETVVIEGSQRKLGVVSHKLEDGIQMVNGEKYYVTVTATNGAGPRLAKNRTSKAVMTDSTPPVAGDVSIINERLSETTVNSTSIIGASWDRFEDNETDILGYEVQLFNVAGDHEVEVTGLIDVGDNNITEITNLTLQAGEEYFLRVHAVNEAGLQNHANSATIKVVSEQEKAIIDFARGSSLNEEDGLTSIVLGLIIVAALLAGALAAGLMVMLLVRSHSASIESEERSRIKTMKDLMYGLIEGSSETELYRRRPEELRDQREVAFVITDLESSTAQSNASQSAFNRMLELHNMIIREILKEHSGYEIGT